MKRISRILMAIDGSERSFAASVYLGKMLSKQAEIVFFHVMVEAPEAFRDVSADPLSEKENYPFRKILEFAYRSTLWIVS